MDQWSSNIESVRKDVKCTFNILKKRFLFLKNPIELHAPDKIQASFFTCAALHNWLHNYDGWGDWEGRSGLITEDDVMVEYASYDEPNHTHTPFHNIHLKVILQGHRQGDQTTMYIVMMGNTISWNQRGRSMRIGDYYLQSITH